MDTRIQLWAHFYLFSSLNMNVQTFNIEYIPFSAETEQILSIGPTGRVSKRPALKVPPVSNKNMF